MRKALVTVFVLLFGSLALGATVFREEIAQAAQSISATIVGPLDANNNVAVHEQGTVDVIVKNSNLSVAPPTPVIGGGGAAGIQHDQQGEKCREFAPQTATALSIGMTPGLLDVVFNYQGSNAATFVGPGQHGNDAIVLALSRPITFDQLCSFGLTAGAAVSVSWVGAEP
jgi:hypothetical protein